MENSSLTTKNVSNLFFGDIKGGGGGGKCATSHCLEQTTRTGSLRTYRRGPLRSFSGPRSDNMDDEDLSVKKIVPSVYVPTCVHKKGTATDTVVFGGTSPTLTTRFKQESMGAC